MNVPPSVARRPLGQLLEEGLRLRRSLRLAADRSQMLVARADMLRRAAVAARMASRPGSAFARLDGRLGTVPVQVLVRRDGTVVGDLSAFDGLGTGMPERSAGPAPAPEGRAVMASRLSWGATRAGNPLATGISVDPLLTTLELVRACDQVTSVRLLAAGCRYPLAGATLRASLASGDAPGVPERPRLRAGSELLSSDVTTSGSVQVVRLRGELDLASADELKNALLMVRARTIVVDLEHVTFLDASGLSALLVARTGVTATGRRFKIRGARGLVRRVFEVTDLAHFLEE